MSDNPTNGASANGSDAKKWTEGEKYTLLLKIIKQLTDGGAKIKLADLDMPGRTPKALSHTIAAIKKEASQSNGSNGGGGGGGGGGGASVPATPTGKRGKAPGSGASGATTPGTGRKRAKKADPEANYEDGDSEPSTPAPKRQRRPGPAKKNLTPAKVEDSDSSDIKPVLSKLAGDDDDGDDVDYTA
ncbi:hypothetical protein F5X99DRAFT_406557 [Biscogniauxia marginata]|nr:hypothetical protein F5X99DRAFT_406557 [Biscogniauxia marginata]